jgi:NADH-quinone oxidoreductase subunit A
MPLLENTSNFSFDIKYYLFAMFFVILDAESIFIFTWAVAAKELGIRAYTAILVFIIILFIALLYLWKSGALDWMHGRRAANRRLRCGRLQ